MRRLLPAIIFLSLLLPLACAKREVKEESPVLKAYRLIDADRTDEAISLLENLLEDEPDNEECQEVLASAYAHKAGIRIQTLVPAVKNGKDLSEAMEAAKKDAEDESLAVSQKVDSFLGHSTTVLGAVGGFSEAYRAIPSIDNEDLVYLMHAIRILENIHKPSQSTALYRAVLKVVQFKFALANRFSGPAFRMAQAETACPLDLANVSGVLADIGNQLVDIIDDIILAQPDQSKSLEATRSSVENAVASLTMADASSILLDEKSDSDLKRNITENNLGKLLQCKGAGL